jgi:alkaline phosphatase
MKRTLIYVVAAALLTATVSVGGLWIGVPNANIRMVGFPSQAAALKVADARRPQAQDFERVPKNIVIFIADGMGYSHMTASNLVHHGIDGSSVWERFEHDGWHQPHLIDGLVTDSAASATAFSTGSMTTSETVALDADGKPMRTLQLAKAQGYRTGIVTDSFLWDATPAAFIAHSRSRRDYSSIARQMAEAELDILYGEIRTDETDPFFRKDALISFFSKNYKIFEDVAQATAADPSANVAIMLPRDFAIKKEVGVTLLDLTRSAMARLRGSESGYVLIVESEEPDSASHRKDFARLMAGMRVIEDTAALLYDEAKQDGETLFIFTSDHETGGLALLGKLSDRKMLDPIWATTEHTANPVPIFAIGPGAERIVGLHTNHEIGKALHAMLEARKAASAAAPEQAQTGEQTAAR